MSEPAVATPAGAAANDPVAPRVHVDVLDRRARLRLRTHIDALPCTVGRSFACDIVLDDRFVSPEHIAITRAADGAIVIEDLNSTNGLYDLRAGRLVARLPVIAGTTVRIGQTLLRFHTADEPVEPALPLPRTFATPAWAVLPAFAALFAISGFSTYLETYTALSAGPFVFATVVLAVFALVWAGSWALLSRVLQHQSYFAEHCIIVCAFLSAYILSGWVIDYYSFAVAAESSATVLEWVLPTTLLAAVLYGHLLFCSTLPSPQLLARAFGVAGGAAALAGLVVLSEALEPDWTAVASFRGGLKPPLFQLAGRDDLDGFFSRVEKLKSQVDTVAELEEHGSSER